MTKQYRDYRRKSGMAQFERDCRLTYEAHKRKKAYKVPGTQEAGRYAMYIRGWQDTLNQQQGGGA